MYRIALAVALIVTGGVHAQTREEKVRADRKRVESDGYWIYNDLPRGFAEARRTGKPLLVVLRCIPCEECVKLDDEPVNRDRRVRPLLDRFVRVRVVSANGLDLSLFQFDYDQSFAAFLLNADGTIYGRFGTRSHRKEWSDDVSIEGLAAALRGALDLHRGYPKNRAQFAGKKGPPPDVKTPEKHPLLRGRYGAKLDYAGEVVPSCIHCHQIGDAQRQAYRDRGEAIPEELLFSYPHPKTLGLILDPREKATVRRVEKGSLAENAGLEKGDEILRLAGQPLLSIADVQWVLHRSPAAGGPIAAEVVRDGCTSTRTLLLPKGWRRREDISWRASTWGLRRMAGGGLLLEAVPAETKKEMGVGQGGMALRVRHVGQFGPHAAAKNAGFVAGDVLVSFDGRTDLRRETDLLAHALGTRKPGDRVPVVVHRGGKKVNLMLPMQK